MPRRHVRERGEPALEAKTQNLVAFLLLRGIKFRAQRGREVIALIVGPAVIGGLVVGWYGYRTLTRIQTWGEKMNEQDAIFRSAATAEELDAYTRSTRNGVKADAVRAAHLPVRVPH